MQYFSNLIKPILYGCLTGLLESTYILILVVLPIYLITSKNNNNSKINPNFKQLLKKYNTSNTNSFKFIDKFSTIYFCFITYLFVFSIFIFFGYVMNETVDTDTVESINNISNTIYTIISLTLSLIIICASLKKDYYIVFNSNDVSKKYKIRFCSINLIVILTLTIVNQMILYTSNHVICYFCIYPLITLTIFISIYLLIITLYLLFPNTKIELTILNSLDFMYKKNKNFVIKNDNDIGTNINIQYLCNEYILQLSKLNKKCNNIFDNNFICKYSNNKSLAKRLFYNCFKSTISTIICLSLVSSLLSSLIIIVKTKNILSTLLVFVSNSITLCSMLLFILFLLCKIKPIKKRTCNIILGENIYSISYNRTIKYYFSDLSFPFIYYHDGVKWIRSLKNLDAFYKIYTNTNNPKLQLDKAKYIIHVYKDQLDLFFNEQSTNPFIILPLILFFYHSYVKFKNKDDIINLINEQSFTWNKEIHSLVKSIIKDFYEDTSNLNSFFKDTGLNSIYSK